MSTCTNVLIITGSRVLSELSIKRERQLRRFLAKNMLLADIVVFGDAEGPDTWAQQIADAAGIRYSCWCSHKPNEGAVIGVGPTRWAEGKAAGDHKKRDREMVAWWTAQNTEQTPMRIACLAFIATWSKTKGAEYTLQEAAHRNLFCSALVIEKEAA